MQSWFIVALLYYYRLSQYGAVRHFCDGWGLAPWWCCVRTQNLAKEDSAALHEDMVTWLHIRTYAQALLCVCMCMYMYVLMYVRMYVCLFVFMYVCMFVRKHIMCSCTYMSFTIQMHTHVPAYVHRWPQAYMHSRYMNMCIILCMPESI